MLAGILIFMGISAIYRGFNDDSQKAMFSRYVESAKISSNEQFQRDLAEGIVDTVYYNTNEEYMVYTLLNEDTRDMSREERDDYSYPESNYRRTLYTAGDSFRNQMISYGVNLVLIRDGVTGVLIAQMLISSIPVLAIMWVLSLQLKAQGLNSVTEDMLIKTSNVKLDDIIGLDELKDEIKLIIELLKDSKYGEHLGVKLPSGVLLSGSPGVGKTMIAKAIAKEADVTFISTAASDFQELFVGNGARHIRKIFEIARKHTPCVVFIDEIDAIGVARGRRGSTGEDNQTINALLKEMDGFTENQGIFVLAATNHSDQLDEAIKRSGRFDREIAIPTPRNWKIRKELFKLYLKDKPLSDNVDLDTISRQTPGFTGADIATICNEAGIIALANDFQVITHDCIEEAIDKKVFKGSRSKIKTYDEDKKIVAKHEAGHAVMSWICGEPIARASIISTTSGVGGAVFHEDTDCNLKTKSYFRERIMICYAGRAAEEVSFGKITTGASNDITQATNLIAEYIGSYGFDDEYGLIDLSVISNTSAIVTNTYEERVTKLSRELYQNTLELIRAHKHILDALSEKLLAVQSMTGVQIKEFFEEFEDKENIDAN